MPRSCHFYNLKECFSLTSFPRSRFPTFPDLQKARRDVERVSVIWDATSIIAVCVCVKIGQISRGTQLKPPWYRSRVSPSNVRSVKIQQSCARTKISRGRICDGTSYCMTSSLSRNNKIISAALILLYSLQEVSFQF